MPRKRLFSLLAILTLLISLTIAIPVVHGDGDGPEGFSVPEKQEQQYPNLGSQLNQLVASVEQGQLSAKQAAADSPIHSSDSVAVTIHLSGNVDDVVQFLGDNGGDPRNIGEDYIEAYVPFNLLGQLSEQPGVTRVREIVPPEPSYGEYVSQGVQTHLSQEWNDAGFSGQGVKVGVIDLGFSGLTSLMGSELPTNIQGRCYTDIGMPTDDLSNCDGVDDVSARFPECLDAAQRSAVLNAVHGAAVAESLLDIAPSASLYIANPMSQADLQDAVQWMAAEGVSVINYSVGWTFDGPGDGTSPSSISPLNTVDQAVASDILWVNAAGNDAEGTWFGRYSDPDGDGSLGFGDQNDEIIDLPFRDCRGYRFQLRWEDSWDGAVTDLDLHFVDKANGLIILSGDDVQSGESGQIPRELFGTVRIPRENILESTDFGLIVSHESGPVPDWIQLEVSAPGAIEHFTISGSITNPAESANPGMLAVGASHYWDIHTIADYSSQGPTPDGRVKPDIVGTACGETASYEHYLRNGQDCWFAGTSQASPHVAGLAALVKQRFPGFAPEQVADYLKDNAEQRGSPDPNNTWGHGFAVLPFLVGCGAADITTDGSPMPGDWDNDCASQEREGSFSRYYQFTLAENADISVTLESQDVEPVVYLREGAENTSGGHIALSEGEAEYNYRRASIQQSLNAGTYTIEATTYVAGETGSFTLSLSVSVETGGPPPAPGGCDIADVATDGSEVNGAWANDCQSEVTADRNARYYTFTLDAAAGVTITLDSDDGDDEPVLHLREGESKTGTEVDKNEGIGPDYTRAEIMVESLDAGTYTIEARTYHADYEGPFTLTVSVDGAAPPPVSGDCGIADVATDGSEVNGAWANDCQSEETAGRNAQYYKFSLEEDAEVTIELKADADEPVLHLREGESKTGTEIDSHEGFQDEGYKRAEIVKDLEAGKTYTIEARTYSAGYEGPFTLTVSVTGGTGGPAPIGDCGIADIATDGSGATGTWGADCESGVREGRYARYYQFTLSESADVAVVLESDDAETVLYLREGAGATSGGHIGFNEGEPEHDYRRASIEETLDAGTYTVEATTYAVGETGSFTLTVSGAGETNGAPAPSGCEAAEIEADGSGATGTWGADCESGVREGRYARYYQFTLSESADVTVVLESDDAETVLYLREGAGATSGGHIGFNEGESEHDYRRASIEETLDAGTYTVEATTYAAGETGSFTLTVSGAGAAGGVPVDTALAPLGSNLLWIANFDNATSAWSVYDPSGTFSLSELPPNPSGAPYSDSIGDLTHIQSGDITWIKVAQTQTATLGGETHTFYAGLTLFAWP